ncbi:MAG: peptidoglycan-binding protein [Candidatus Omnitrophica bacterium]|nr:peptidoglycan-binding protein [Candidatus Omnitrophota bacterium]
MGKIRIISLSFLILLSGCATTAKDYQIQGLRNQIQALEAQIQEKNRQIEYLKESLREAEKEREEILSKKVDKTEKKAIIREKRSQPTVRDIQIALKNAGFNPGAIDGKMGRQTRQAIEAFQRANNLTVDGKVGKETWDLLKNYLYKKEK